MNRTPRNACNTSGVSLRGNMLSDSVSATVAPETDEYIEKAEKLY